MPGKSSIPIYDFVSTIAEALDNGYTILSNHYTRVAYLAWRIARQIDLPNNEVQDIIIAAMFHDIGALTPEDKIRMLRFETDEVELHVHAYQGYKLLKDFEPLSQAALLVKFHNVNYCQGDSTVPLGSHIIHLADRIAILFNDRKNILEQTLEIETHIYQEKQHFNPKCLLAFTHLAKQESFWLEASSPTLSSAALNKIFYTKGATGTSVKRDRHCLKVESLSLAN